MPGHQGPVPRSVYETLEVKLCDIFSPAVPWRVPCHMRLGSHRRPLLRFKGFSFGTCRRPSGPSFLGAATVTLLASYGGSGLFDAWGVLAFGSLHAVQPDSKLGCEIILLCPEGGGVESWLMLRVPVPTKADCDWDKRRAIGLSPRAEGKTSRNAA